MGFSLKKTWNKVTSSKAVAFVAPYLTASAAAAGSGRARTALASTWGQVAKPVASYFGGQTGGSLFSQVVDRYANPNPQPQAVEESDGGGGNGGGAFTQAPQGGGEMRRALPWILVAVVGVLGLVLFLRRK